MLTNTTNDDNPTKTWTGKCSQIVKLMVRVFLRELRKIRVGSDMAYGASEPHIWVVQYLWHNIQAHRVMIEFREADFHPYNSI